MADVINTSTSGFVDSFGNKVFTEGGDVNPSYDPSTGFTGTYDFNKLSHRQEAMNKGFYGTGADAVRLAEKVIGELSDQERLLLSHEGFTTVPYWDSAEEPVKTIGMGQTEGYFDPLDIRTGFKKAVADKSKAVKTQFGGAYDAASDLKKGALLSLVYRGDTKYKENTSSHTKGDSHKWVGKYKDAIASKDPIDLDEAYEEFWDNNEYTELIDNNSTSGILSRIRENSEILFGKTK